MPPCYGIQLFADNLQKQFIDLFWQGMHWIYKNILSLSNDLGGQGSTLCLDSNVLELNLLKTICMMERIHVLE